jgi:hypothetical protein
MTKEQDILVLHGAEAHEVLEEWEDEFEQKTFESKLTILSRLQQEKDEDLEMQEWLVHSAKKKNKINASFLTDSATRKEKYLFLATLSQIFTFKSFTNRNTLNIFISLLIFTLLYSDSLSFSDDVAKTTRTGKTRRRMCRSGNRSAKSNSNDSTAKTMRTWRMSSTLFQVKELKRIKHCILIHICAMNNIRRITFQVVKNLSAHIQPSCSSSRQIISTHVSYRNFCIWQDFKNNSTNSRILVHTKHLNMQIQ